MKQKLGVAAAVLFALASVSGLSVYAAAGRAVATRTVTLERGDFARVPAVGWTCNVAVTPATGSHPALLCTSDRKPVRALWISKSRIFVASSVQPHRAARGYVFP